MTRETTEELAEMCKTSIGGAESHRLAIAMMEGMARCLYSLGMREDAEYVRRCEVESDEVMISRLLESRDI